MFIKRIESIPWKHLDFECLFSSPLRAVSSGCKRARRERDASPCGDLASGTATLWKPALGDPHWVSLGFTSVHLYTRMAAESGAVVHLNARWQKRNSFYHSGPEVHWLLFLWHPSGLLWPWSNKGRVKRMGPLLNTIPLKLKECFIYEFLLLPGRILSDRTGSVDEKEGQREAEQRFRLRGHCVWPGNQVIRSLFTLFIYYHLANVMGIQHAFIQLGSVLFPQHQWFQ